MFYLLMIVRKGLKAMLIGSQSCLSGSNRDQMFYSSPLYIQIPWRYHPPSRNLQPAEELTSLELYQLILLSCLLLEVMLTPSNPTPGTGSPAEKRLKRWQRRLLSGLLCMGVMVLILILKKELEQRR